MTDSLDTARPNDGGASDASDRTDAVMDEAEELPEERPRFAEPEPPRERPLFVAEGVLLHPEDDDQIRRNQIDFDGEVGRDGV